MRTAPPLQVTVELFGVWRGVLGLWLAAAALALGLWLGAWQQVGAALPRGFRLALAVAAVLALLAAGTRWRPAPFSLRWDGSQWHVGPPGSAPNEPWSGRVRAAIDVGGWMLLSFAPASAAGRCTYRWLPVQRNADAAQWHALRGAVYSARFIRPPPS